MLTVTPEPVVPESTSASSRRTAATSSLFDPTIMRRAVGDAFRKLDPRQMARNPVMFVVEVGSVVTTVLFFRDLRTSTAADNVFVGLLVGVILIVGGLTFFPALALGPIVEHLAMNANMLF